MNMDRQVGIRLSDGLFRRVLRHFHFFLTVAPGNNGYKYVQILTATRSRTTDQQVAEYTNTASQDRLLNILSETTSD